MYNKRNVLIISHRVDRSGAPTSLLNIVKGLKRFNNFNVNVISMRGGDLRKDFEEQTNHYYSLTNKTKTNFILNLVLIPYFFYLMYKNKDRKTVLINSLANTRAILISYFLRKRIVIYVRESEKMINCTKLGFLRTRSLKLADQVICVSHDTKNWVNKYVNNSKLSVIHNGIELNNFKNKSSKIIKRNIVVGIVGYLGIRKGVDRLIDLAGQILKERGDIDFLIIGEVTDEVYKEKIEALISIYGKRIKITGITDKVIDWLLDCCDLTLMLSREEALPRSILESSFAGVPVVALDVAGTKEMLPDGYPFITKSPDEIKGLIYKIIQDGLLKQGKINQEYLKKDFDLNRNINKIAKILD